jgi:hypothetical protein
MIGPEHLAEELLGGLGGSTMAHTSFSVFYRTISRRNRY